MQIPPSLNNLAATFSRLGAAVEVNSWPCVAHALEGCLKQFGPKSYSVLCSEHSHHQHKLAARKMAPIDHIIRILKTVFTYTCRMKQQKRSRSGRLATQTVCLASWPCCQMKQETSYTSWWKWKLTTAQPQNRRCSTLSLQAHKPDSCSDPGSDQSDFMFFIEAK